MATTTNALLGTPGAPPKYDLVGPTIDDDVRRLIGRYGAQSVKEAATRLTKAKRGRKALRDWAELMPMIDADARDWLTGTDPFAARSNYAMAKIYADENPGHDHASTMQRIERKLRQKRYGRRWYVFVRAMELSGNGYPYAAHIRALEALSEHDPHPVWPKALNRFRADIADYIAKWGTPPDELSVRQVEEGALRALPTEKGLSGLMGKYLADYSPLGKILAKAVDGETTP